MRHRFLLVAVLGLAGVLSGTSVVHAGGIPTVDAAQPRLIPAGVSIGHVSVGNMTAAQARVAVQVAFDVPLSFQFEERFWRATPRQLGAVADVDLAVARALSSPSGSSVELAVLTKGRKVAKYVRRLARTFSRPAREPRLRLIKNKPAVTEARNGLTVRRADMTSAIRRALELGSRRPIPLMAEEIEPATGSASSPIVVIKRESKKLFFYEGDELVRSFRVATGLNSNPTPLGRFDIVVKQKDPIWFPPQTSDWARGLKPVPPGPNNPLGTRWMGLSEPLIGIHGTPDANSIGTQASRGCVRMNIDEAEWLYSQINVGTSVFIVNA